ncbi:MAG TPA: autotransporter-associated beta strand repeat-containing protein [Chthoniobacterales bacterium]|jgi:autotransporter-associated beta strand protein
MNAPFSRVRFFIAAALLFLAAQRPSLADSASWATKPTNGDWNTAANWRPQTVPNSETDIATFGASNVTNVTNTDEIIMLDSLVFSPGAPEYTINALDNIELYGAGIVNNSGTTQSFVAGAIFFDNSATAGDMVNFSAVGGDFFFNDASSAGFATFDLTNGSGTQGHIFFEDDSTAGNATINASASSVVEFLGSSSGGNATFNLTTAAFVLFDASNNAEHMTGNCIGGNAEIGSEIAFQGYSSAGEGTFTTVGGSTSGEQGGFILFDNTATADNATFVVGGGLGAGLSGTSLIFSVSTTAAAADITANGGADGSEGGTVIFADNATGGTCNITLFGNAALDITTHKRPGVTIGSLAGAGSVLLRANTLTIGSNNQSTTFSGVIQGSGGVTKSGTGTLTLSGKNTYTRTTTVSAGTLGGGGTIAGSVTVAANARIAPAAGTTTSATMKIKKALTFQASSSYSCLLSGNGRKVRSDQINAKGVTVDSGAQFVLSDQITGRLRSGTSFTVISNTASTPISGTFANLPDGAILTVGDTKLQASYEGGDGNDLTLAVVP